MVSHSVLYFVVSHRHSDSTGGWYEPDGPGYDGGYWAVCMAGGLPFGHGISSTIGVV